MEESHDTFYCWCKRTRRRGKGHGSCWNNRGGTAGSTTSRELGSLSSGIHRRDHRRVVGSGALPSRVWPHGSRGRRGLISRGQCCSLVLPEDRRRELRRTITSSGCECARPCALQRRVRLILLYARLFAQLPSKIQPRAFELQSAPAAPARFWKRHCVPLGGEPNERRLPASLTV